MNPDVLGVNELENDGFGPGSAIQFLVDKLNEATAPGTYAFIDADAEHGPGQRARHRRDQGVDVLQARRGDAGRTDGGAELRRVRERRRLVPAQPALARAGLPGERDRGAVHRRRQPPEEQGQRLRRAGCRRRPGELQRGARERGDGADELARVEPDRHRRPGHPARRRLQQLRDGGPDHGHPERRLHEPRLGVRRAGRVLVRVRRAVGLPRPRARLGEPRPAGRRRRRLPHQLGRAVGARLQHRLQDGEPDRDALRAGQVPRLRPRSRS